MHKSKSTYKYFKNGTRRFEITKNGINIMKTGETQQTNLKDFHMWCVDDKNNIKDNFKNNNPTLKLVYKEWEKTPDYLLDLIEQRKEKLAKLSKEEKLKIFKYLNDSDYSCDSTSILKNEFFGWKIKVGSLGIIQPNGEILYEFGNGKKYADYDEGKIDVKKYAKKKSLTRFNDT